MMPQALGSSEQGEPPDPAQMMDAAAAALAALEGVLPGLLARPGEGGPGARAAHAALVVLRDLTAKLDSAMVGADIAAEREIRRLATENARLRADLDAARAGARPRRGRHAGDRPILNVVRGAAPAAIIGAGAGAVHGTRHAVMLKLAAGATAAGLVGGTVAYGVQRADNETPYTAPSGHHRAAVPVSGPVPSPVPVVTLYMPQPKGRHHRRPAPAPSVSTPPASPPPSASPPSPSPVPAGSLYLQAPALALRPSPSDPAALTAVITFVAAGGPVPWSVSQDAHGAVPLRLDARSGTLREGQTGTITVSVAAASVAAGQSWTLTLQPGGQQVTVTVAA